MAGLVLYLLPLGVLGLCAQLLWDGVTMSRVLGVVAALMATALACVWAYRASRSGVTLQLTGDTLFVGGRGAHQLGPNSLMAIRSKEPNGNTMGTVLSINLGRAGNQASDASAEGGGARLMLLFPSVVPSSRYFSEVDVTADAWLDPSGNELLDRLSPYLVSNPGADPRDGDGYAFVLRHAVFLGAPKADSVSIAGDGVAVGLGGKIVRQARAHEIAFTLYAFEQPQGDGPSKPNAPALMLEFMNPSFAITIGAAPMSVDDHWKDLTVGARPEYMLGLGELLRLVSVLEAGRARFRGASSGSASSGNDVERAAVENGS